MKNKTIEIISNHFKDDVRFSEENNVLFVDKIDSWIEIAKFINKDKNLLFDYLMCISSYDLADNNRIGLAYNFHSTKLKQYIEIRIEFEDTTEIESVESIWKAADWHEREAYDMMGVKFSNHPNLKRILLPEDWEGHPLRKDYKTPDYYNGMPIPKDKSYWE